MTTRMSPAASDPPATAPSKTAPYDLQRSSLTGASAASLGNPSMEYSHAEDDDDDDTEVTDSYVAMKNNLGAGDGSVLTASPYPYPDATQTVHEMYLALLYLLSHPSEFQKALQQHPPRGATTLAEWNQEYYYDDDDNETLTTTTTANNNMHPLSSKTLMTDDGESEAVGDDDDDDDDDDEFTTTTNPHTTPLPFVVFADDAEVVLPQAHTASQLFGVERLEGMELEAAAGVPALSQLFLRWLALLPGGDHLNTIDPPGLTVMKIAGGRYRVTAAHRVVWT